MQTIEKNVSEIKSKNIDNFERYIISFTALLCAGILIILAIMGPLGLQVLKYRASQSVYYQVRGQDLVNLLLLVPLCVIGAVLHFRGNDNSKYFLIHVGLYLGLYVGFAYGLGQEWSNPAYEGNPEKFFWLYQGLMVGSLLLFISSFSMFSEEDAPDFNPKTIKKYVILMTIFLVLFVFMWIKEVVEVQTTGNTSSGSYLESPTIFWLVKYLDLGITIPIGFISLYLFITRPKKAYPLLLAFFGFLTTLVTAVMAMALAMLISNDPNLQPEALIIFPILMILSWSGWFFLVKQKIPVLRKN